LSDKKQVLNSKDPNEVDDIITSNKNDDPIKPLEKPPENMSSEESEESVVQQTVKRKRKPLHLIVGSFLYGIWRVTRILILIGIVIGSLFAAAYVLQQDELVRHQFEGKRWALPARVFARPLELYEGKSLVPDDLQQELQLLNYTFVTHLVGTGQYKRNKNTFYIQTRGFQFADDQEISRRIRVDIRRNRIVKLTNTESNEQLTLMRLEPVFVSFTVLLRLISTRIRRDIS